MPQVRDAAWDRIHRLQDAQAFTSLNQRSLVVRALAKAHPWGVSVGGASALEGCDIHDYHHPHINSLSSQSKSQEYDVEHTQFHGR
jgi:hypothetical protein